VKPHGGRSNKRDFERQNRSPSTADTYLAPARKRQRRRSRLNPNYWD
jgi:hypothetical protein